MAHRELERLDKKHLWHPFTQQFLWEKDPTLIVERGRGVYFYDVDGKKYLDGVSSLWVNLLGHNHPALNRAFKQQLSKIAHSTFLGLSHRPGIELARDLLKIAPKNLSRVFYSDNGATAVEIALKMAFQYWIEKTGQARIEYLAVDGSYHGDTLGAVSVGSIGAFHSKFKPLLFKAHFAKRPACAHFEHRCRTGEKTADAAECVRSSLASVEKILKARRGKIAAAILEPVIQGATGMHVQPPGYVKGFRRLCDKYNVLMIADEVATGFGRTGTMFAVEQENVRPDFLCLAKALTAGYTPLAATLTTERVYRAFYGPLRKNSTFFHGHSYTGHPLGAAVARANLQVIQRTKLLEKTRESAHLMRDELRSFEALPAVKSVRQAGLMAGVELAEKGMGKRVCRGLLKKGIWLRPLSDTVVIMPPPVISQKDLRFLLATLKNVILHESKT
jgi:adenosylmethionine-8-amino-7-oxononanoate transaminase